MLRRQQQQQQQQMQQQQQQMQQQQMQQQQSQQQYGMNPDLMGVSVKDEKVAKFKRKVLWGNITSDVLFLSEVLWMKIHTCLALEA